ncbi:MAG TPA: hypothetical protein VNI02_25935 [Blastocatellia bacterium]|jgi:hypothetical protein|nr:hypothetical protein [Blastocatellia bacterium]
MIDVLYRSTAKLSITLLLIVSLTSAAAPSAAAFQASEDKNKEDARAVQASKSTGAMPIAATAPATVKTGAKPLSISYALYKEAASQSLHTIPLPKGAPAVSTAPMTAGEKFSYWAKRFKSPGSYGAAIASGLWNELLDNDEGKEDTLGNYFADAATRAARSYAFGTTAGFFEKFAYATIFRQDPRYHRSDKRGAGAKIGYAVSRVFITQGDRCGCDQFNISFLAGGLTAAGISNVWEREERQTVGKTFQRWGTHIGITAMTNILREFIGGQ